MMIETQSSIDEFAHTARRDDVVGPDKRTLKDACYLLLNCSLFGGLRPDERAEVVALARVRTFNAGETVFAIGSPGDQMMALLSGTIRISVPSSGGKELLLAVIQPGEVFGELAVLDGKERSADAVAETACTEAMLRVLNWEADSAAAEPAKIRFSQRELANMLGGSRESVNKCLRNWQRTGVVRISGGSIIISDRRALENIAE